MVAVSPIIELASCQDTNRVDVCLTALELQGGNTISPRSHRLNNFKELAWLGQELFRSMSNRYKSYGREIEMP